MAAESAARNRPGEARPHSQLADRLAGVAGVAFVVLFVASSFVGASELAGVDHTADAIARDLLENRHDGLQMSVLLISLATICGFCFLGLLHGRLVAHARSPETWAALAGGSGLVIAVMILGVILSADLAVDSLANDPEAAKMLWLLEQGTWTLMTPALAAFVLAISVGAIRHGDPPRWFGWTGLVVTAALVANTWFAMGSPIVLGLAWVLVLAVIMIVRTPPTLTNSRPGRNTGRST